MTYFEVEPGHETVVGAIDLTDFDFSNSQLYMCRSDTSGFEAYQLTVDETIEHKWGIQEMVAGDWVVLKPSSKGGFKKSGVRNEAFEKTYVELTDGRFRKESYILAEQFDQPFTFIGVDSDEPERAKAGSFLVLNLDKFKQPILINGRRDIFYYNLDDLESGYVIQQQDSPT